MTSPLTLITGGSRGLGWALVQNCLEAGHRVLCIARRPPPASPAGLTVWTRDLEDALPVSEDLERWLSVQPVPTEVNLINNAGVIAELCDLSEGDGADLRRALRVGLEAPTLLTSAFLRATSAWTVPRRVVLVSSGLGRRAMAGSATYCAAKAGMDHLARAVALEEAARPHGARVVSLAPGVIDTDMQQQLRGADPTRFADRGRFVALQTTGQLDSPVQAAERLMRYLRRPDFGTNPVGDVRDA